MKSVLRSCFDPLPRFMSTRSLVGLVTMVLVGTGISVYEYLESSHAPVRASSTFVEEYRDSDSGPATDCDARERVGRCRTPRDQGFTPQPPAETNVERVSDCTRAAASDVPSAPSVFEPANPQAGS